MGFTSRDMYAEVVDSDLLRRALRRSGLSYQELADEATSELRRIARSERRKRRGDGVPDGVSKSLVERLVNQRTKTTHELRAIAIERSLGVTDGDLFAPRMLHGAHAVPRSA